MSKFNVGYRVALKCSDSGGLSYGMGVIYSIAAGGDYYVKLDTGMILPFIESELIHVSTHPWPATGVTNLTTCQHIYEAYKGIMDQYDYCTKCDHKKRYP